MGKEIKMENTVNNEEVVKQYEFLKTSNLEKMTTEEIEALREEYNKKQEEQGKLLQTKMYSVNIETQANLNLIKKWLTKEVEWDHQSVPTLVAVYEGLKKTIELGVDENGVAFMTSLTVGNLYQYLLTFKGKGYDTAKGYLTLLTKTGGPISEAMKELADDNENFRNIHQDLATLDQVLEAKAHGIKVEDLQEENFKKMKEETPQ